MDRARLVLQAVAGIEVGVLVGVESLKRAGPRPHLFGKDPRDAGDRVEMEMPADVRVAEAGAEQERRCLERAAGYDDRAGADGYLLPSARHGCDPGRAAALDEHARRRRIDDDPCTCGVRVRETSVDCFAPSWQPNPQ